ncbi:MAG: hypothetical protein LIO87_03685 [Eubacterium sp.]|nr:hypothetical protein [Eubacterium sp.]
MKKLLLILCVFVFVISVTSCGSSDGVSQEEYDALLAEIEELKGKQEANDDTEEEAANEDISENDETAEDNSPQSEDAIEIVAEYSYADSIGWYNYHFIVIKNNTNETLSVSSSSIAYDADGNVLGADDASFDALGAGCTSVMREAFDIEGVAARYDTTVSSAPPSYYESVIQDLTYTESNIASGAVFQVTNNGSEAAEFVEGYALFFKDGNLVGYDDAYFTDDDSEIKPGATVTKQLDINKEFDSIQFYLDGRR